jgi:DNA polymerase III gamma/tau subunit
MSLYLKYRPTTLEQVKGNEDIITSLTKMLSDKKTCPHVFLFHGLSGCGKTTLGRIVANSLGCSEDDLAEINSASFRGIDTVRDIIRNCEYKPINGSCRVFLIDEVHKWTNDAQNAALKILEDTPAHVYFILCTTQPDKLIKEIHGRCQKFQVKPLNDIQLTTLLRRVVREEGQTLDKTVYDQIIINSFGQPRNALQILEQVLNVPEERRVEAAKQAAAEQSQSIELCRALLRNAKWKEISVILKGLKDQDAEGIRRQVLGYCQAVLLNEDNPKAGFILEQMRDHFYDVGFPGLTLATYIITKS